MMSEPCRDMRGALGAAALGNLQPAEEVALRAHLDGCAACREELRALTSVARALPLADPKRVDAGSTQAPRELGDLVLGRIASLRTARRLRMRRRAMTGVAAAIAVAAAVVAFAVVAPGSHGGATRVTFPASGTAAARATLHARTTGTEVSLHVSGLHEGDYYWLWLTGDDGDRVGAGTFQGSARAEDITMMAALPLDEARRVWVTDAEDRVVLDTRI